MYPLTDALIDFLQTERAAPALEELARADLSESATLRVLDALRKRFAPSEAAALLDQARLRTRAVGKFASPELLLYTDDALQQASSRVVSRYRMAGFARFSRVADLGCGVGADTLALAESVPEVLAVERDPLRARLAEANVAASGLASRVQVVCADWTTLELDVSAAFADPSRRAGGRRLYGLERMDPPISTILALVRKIPHVAVKVAPGVDHGEVPPSAELEFISEKGHLKEALLRFGGLRSGAARTATLLPGRHQLARDAEEPDARVRDPAAYIYEPDPAVIRAGLVRSLGASIGAAQIDSRIAYLTGDARVPTPFARAWGVLRHGHFHLKTLNRWLRELHAGDVIVKKRGSAIEPEPFRRRLATTPGGPTLTVFLTRFRDQPWMIVGADPDMPHRPALARSTGAAP